MVIGLDYGHGLSTPRYAKRYTFPDGFEVVEGHLNRLIALEVLDQLLERGVVVYDLVAQKLVGRVHELEDEDVKLRARTRYANSLQLDLVLSIHCNCLGNRIAGPDRPTASGVVLFTYLGESKSDEYARSIGAELERHPQMKLKQIREANHHMTRETQAPAVLCESGFFTNRAEVERLLTREYRVELAGCYVRGVCGA